MSNQSKSLSIAVAIFMAFISPLLASDGVTFASFNTGTITGGGAPFTKALDVSALPNTEYVFVSVTANYAPGTAPHDGYSDTMKMEINNGSSTVYWPLSIATMGVLPAGGATTLTWTGVLPKSYIGGGNLSVKFEDDFTDGSGPYTSALNNVVVKIYPAPAPKKTFASFNTGTITGASGPFIKALDVSGLPNTEYLLVTVTGDYAPGTAPHDGFSSTMKMEINNGSSTVYWPLSVATTGVLPGAGATTLTWTGVLPRSYIGGGNLSVKFEDDFTDGSGPYTSALNNVAVTIYPAPTPKKTFTSFNTGTITGAGTPFTKALDVSGLPNTEYLLVTVTGDYAPGTAPHDGFSSTMKMEINNGSSTVYWPLSTATIGVLPADGATTLIWTGVLPKSYIGGGNLSIKFEDDFTDANGPYTSALNNVNATLYPVFSSPPGITSPLTAGGSYGSAISAYTITANNSPTGYGASGLPAGLTINTVNGQITGTPLTNGVFSVSISATNLGGAGTATLVFTIAKAALTVSGVTANDKPYDGNTNATINISGAVFHGVANGDSLTLNSSSATASFSSKNIGADKTVIISGLAVSGAGSANYTFTQPTATADITAASLTITGVTANNKVYNGTTNATLNTGSVTLNGVVNGDDVTLNSSSATGAFTDKTVANGKTVVTSGFTIGGTDFSNYTLTQPTATADITAASLTITGVTANNKVYNGTTNATLNTGSVTLNGVINGDDVTLNSSSATGAFTDKTVANGKTVVTSGFTIEGTDFGNYSLTQPTATADITAAGLTITGVTANSKVYNGNTNATLNTGSVTLNGVINGDDVTLNSSSATGAFTDKTVANGKTVVASGFTIGGTDFSNYTLTQPTATADITAAGLTITGVTANSKVYNGTTNATLNTGSVTLNGVINGDDVTLNSSSATGAFTDKTVANGKTVVASGFTIGGTDFSNYTLTQPTATADITAAGLTITGVTANDKPYDGTTNATLNTGSAALSGIVNGDVVTLNSSAVTGAFSDSAVANNKTVTISGFTLGGDDATNYTVTQPTATASITAAAATIVLGNLTPAYDGTAKAVSAVTTPNGLTVSLTYDGSANAPTNAGNYTVVGTVTDASYSGAVTNTLVIAKIPLTATANDATRYFNQTNPTFTGTLSGNIPSDNLTVSFSTSATLTSPAATYAIAPSINDPDGRLGNYDVALVNGTLTVSVASPAITMATNSIFYTVGQNPATIAPLAVFSSPSSPSFVGGMLTLTVVSNLSPVDILGVNTNELFTVADNGVSDGGSLFATYSGGTAGLNAMQFTFNSGANEANIGSLLTNLTFSVSTTNNFDITNLTRVVQLDFSDGNGLTSAPVMLAVTLNFAPVANIDRISTATNLPVAVSFARMLENDSDPDGDPITLIQVDSMSQQGGTVVSNATGVVYTPPADYAGADQFTYSLSDGRSGLATGVVSLHVLIPGQISIEKAPHEWGLSRPADIGVMGLPGHTYRLIATEDFSVWTSLQTNIAPADGFMHFFDEDSTNHPYRFYRSVTP